MLKRGGIAALLIHTGAPALFMLHRIAAANVLGQRLGFVAK